MSEKKAARGFNVLDFIILAAVLAVIVGICWRFNLADRIGVKADRDTVEIAFLIQEVKETSAEALVIGDEFRWVANDMTIGELKSKEVFYAEAFVENDKGELVKTYNDTRRDIRGVITAKGVLSDSGFMLGGTQYLAPGKTLVVKSKDILVTMTITNITLVS